MNLHIVLQRIMMASQTHTRKHSLIKLYMKMCAAATSEERKDGELSLI